MTVRISTKWLKITNTITRKQIKNALLSNKAIYTISPSLFPQLDYWRKDIKVLGYHQINREINGEPNKDLNNFLENTKIIGSYLLLLAV